MQALEAQRRREEERAAKRLYRENRRVRRRQRRDQYNKWFRTVFLGNLVRWTWWTDKGRLNKELIDLKSCEIIHMVRKILKSNTLERLLNGLHRFRYMEFPFSQAMLRFKYTVERHKSGLFLTLNTSLMHHTYIREIILP